MLEIFYTDRFDNKTALETDTSSFTYHDLKMIISSAAEILKNKKQNIIISDDDNFCFIIKFFAALFTGRNVYLLPDLRKLPSLHFDYDVFSGEDFKPHNKMMNFSRLDEKNTVINFFTSGSSAEPKMIKKSLYNLIKEGGDLRKELPFMNDDMTVMSSVQMHRLFGMTFHLMFPLCSGFKIYAPSILYPSDVNKKNAVFVSSPVFLSTAAKYESSFGITPECIITAGSKLNEKVFEKMQKITNVIEIYGSTETGVIAYKTKHNEPFQMFSSVNAQDLGGYAGISSPYAYENPINIYDKIETEGRNLIIKNRTDRVLKIYDKRINAEEIENRLNEHEFCCGSFFTVHLGKPACMCALNKTGQDFFIKNGIFMLEKELKGFLCKYFEIVPKKWKFIDEIPCTRLGKINKDLINHIFDVNLPLPLILNRNAAADEIEYEIFFYRGCKFFEGHFPDYKILPGVVQIYTARELAAYYFNVNLDAGQWKRIKFSKIILPDKKIKLNLKKIDGRIEYKFYDSAEIYSSGAFMIQNVFEEIQCS